VLLRLTRDLFALFVFRTTVGQHFNWRRASRGSFRDSWASCRKWQQRSNKLSQVIKKLWRKAALHAVPWLMTEWSLLLRTSQQRLWMRFNRSDSPENLSLPMQESQSHLVFKHRQGWGRERDGCPSPAAGVTNPENLQTPAFLFIWDKEMCSSTLDRNISNTSPKHYWGVRDTAVTPPRSDIGDQLTPWPMLLRRHWIRPKKSLLACK